MQSRLHAECKAIGTQAAKQQEGCHRRQAWQRTDAPVGPAVHRHVKGTQGRGQRNRATVSVCFAKRGVVRLKVTTCCPAAAPPARRWRRASSVAAILGRASLLSIWAAAPMAAQPANSPRWLHCAGCAVSSLGSLINPAAGLPGCLLPATGASCWQLAAWRSLARPFRANTACPSAGGCAAQPRAHLQLLLDPLARHRSSSSWQQKKRTGGEKSGDCRV